MAKKKKISKEALTLGLLGAISAFSWIITTGIVDLFGLDNLQPIGKVLIGIGGVIGIGLLANKYLNLNIKR